MGGAEDGVEFGSQARHGDGVRVQEVEGVGDRGGGRVVAGEDEGLDLVDGCGAEGGVHARGGRGGGGGGRMGLEVFLVRLQREVDDGAFAVALGCGGAIGVAVGLRSGRCEALVEFFADEAVELAAVQP